MGETTFSWAVVLCSFGINLLLDGLVRISGMLFVSVHQVFDVSRHTAAFPFALCVAIRNISGPFVGILAGKFGPGSVTLLGGLISAAAIGISYFSKSVTHLVLSWGVLFGIGYGMGNILLTVVIARTCQNKMATASGIAYSGSCIGSLVLPPLMQFLLSVYALHGTFLVFSGIVLHCVPLSLLLLRKLSDSQECLYSCRKRGPKSLPTLTDVHVPEYTPGAVKSLTDQMTTVPRSEEADSGKGSSSWQDALEDKYSFLSTVSSAESLHAPLSVTASEKSARRNRTENKSSQTKDAQSGGDENSSTQTTAQGLLGAIRRNASCSDLTKFQVGAKFFLPSECDAHETTEISDGISTVTDAHLTEIQVPSVGEQDEGKMNSTDAYKIPVPHTNYNSELPVSLQENISIRISNNSGSCKIASATRRSNSVKDLPEKVECPETSMPEDAHCKVQATANEDIKSAVQSSVKSPLKRRTYPEIKVSVVEYVLTAPDHYSEDHIDQRLNSRNNKYRRHANSVSYSLESPNFIFEPAEKWKLQRRFTSKSLTNFCNPHSYSSQTEHHQAPTIIPPQPNSNLKQVLKSLTIFKNPVFSCIALMMTIYEFIFVTVSTIIIDYSRDVGCEETTGKWILMAFAVGNIFSRIFMGRVTDKGYLSANVFAAVCFCGISLAMIGMAFSNGFPALLATIAVFGVAESGVITMFPVLTKDFIEEDQLTMALSSGYFAPGLIVLAIPVGIGGFRVWRGSYVGLFYVTAGMSALGILTCLALPWVKRKHKGTK